MPRLPRRRLSRLILFCVLGAIVLSAAAAIVAAIDWWICLPEGETASYVGRKVCRECHQEEAEAWTGSDHDMAMDRATAATVLGNFGDREFTHVAFDDVVKLSNEDVRTVLEHVETGQWALALHDAAEELKQKILGNLAEEARMELVAELEWLSAVRPCDVTDAQQQVGDVLRRLKDEGKITVDFAVTSKLFRRGDEFFVTTDNREGRMETFAIKYVFGVRPLQQYLVEFPDGRVQCLPITWDTENKQWYHLYPKEPIPSDDVLHWTRPYQNWNYMCAECHTTNLQKNFNLAENTYHTTWSEIDVSCETCHGPGSLHVKLAESDGRFGFWDRRYGFGLPNLKSDNPRVEIETCAPCHSRRRIVHPNCRPGEKLLDYYMPEVLDGNLYYADGQILDEDYVYGSFIQSRMYDQAVRCTDCHDPHTARVKFNDNRLCGQCHVPAKYDAPSHHHHPDATQPGTLCVECHMPETTYMVVDPRRDHSLRVPRPDLTVWLGIPNACNGCHNDRSQGETPQWAEEKVEQWYGKRKEPLPFAYAIAAARELKPEGEKQLADVARRKDARAIVRASAISLLSQYGSGRAEAAAFAGLEDTDELVRAVSVRSLQYLPVDQLHRRLAPMLHDPVRAVRTEAARLLTRVPTRMFSKEDREAFDVALAEYLAGQEAVADQAAAHLNVAVVHTNLGQRDLVGLGTVDPKFAEKADREYRAAIRLDPLFMPAKINLAMLCDQLGRKDEAEELFRQIIQQEPDLAEAHYSLGLLLAENEDRFDEAVGFLETAARLAPENARIHYNYGLALQKLGRAKQAEASLKAALRLAAGPPDSVQFLHALAILYAQQEQWNEAIACAEQLARIQPRNREWLGLLQYLREQSQRAGKPKPDSPSEADAPAQ